jgi:DNA (cytosine-5)-methyltransferase 1
MARSNIQQMKINHLDLFSGIGGFHLGFERAGYEITSYFSEIDKHAIAVYKHQFPTSTYVGSVTDVRGADLPNINLITFGSPCQDFSLAGKRKGMEGQRSSLVLEAIRLISECRPSVFVWENVKGTFSSNDGADFWAIIQAFADIGGYRLEWQLLNTSWFLPQNRERIYLVGYSTTTGGDWGGALPIKDKSREIVKIQGSGANTNSVTTRQGADTQGSYILIQGEQGSNIRRLTPIECERLQGFPDQHTAYGNYDGEVKPMNNSQRYKQCGNAVTVDVVAAVAKKCLPLFN